MNIKTVDSKGRVNLGKEYAGKIVILLKSEGDSILVIKAVVIPESELRSSQIPIWEVNGN